MLKLYDFFESGNAYKVRLLLHQLEIPHEKIEMDILIGATRTPEFLAEVNPNGRVPVLALEDGTCLAESGAILWYLAEATSFLPDDRLARAQVLQWMFFEQYSHEPYIAVVRFWVFSGTADAHRGEIEERRKRGYDALDVMERHLANSKFLVANRYTIADVALYAYTHVCAEGGFDLGAYPAIRAWLTRVSEQPRHIPITAA